MPSDLDKAGKHYWDNVWEGQAMPALLDPASSSIRHYQDRAFHRLFSRVLPRSGAASASSSGGAPHAGLRLLEIGAARSTWLPYFNREFGCQVMGIDYSETGCRQANALLVAAGVDGSVVCADFFAPPPELLGAFDVVVSFGVVEHFRDTPSALSSFAGFLRPGGLMITSIPNLTGLLGWIQKRLSRVIYDIHVPLDREALAAAHRRAGLHVRSCFYFMSANFSIVNFSDWPRGFVYRMAVKLKAAASLLVWSLDSRGFRIRPNKFTSPYVICLATKPGAHD